MKSHLVAISGLCEDEEKKKMATHEAMHYVNRTSKEVDDGIHTVTHTEALTSCTSLEKDRPNACITAPIAEHDQSGDIYTASHTETSNISTYVGKDHPFI